MESLHKHLDPSCLPANYGGKLPAFDYSSADWFPVLKSIESNVSGMYYHFNDLTIEFK